MRFPSFLLPLALLLSIGSISAAPTLMSGTWSNPKISQNTSTYCCIPTSIEIHRDDSDYTAYYRYPSSLDSNCWNLFSSSTKGNMKLYKNGTTYYTESAFSEITFYGDMRFIFFATNSTGSPRLNVNAPSSPGCDFTMYSREAPATDATSAFILGFGFMIGITACCRYNKYKKDKENREITRQLAKQQPIVVSSYDAPPVYVAPSDAMVAQEQAKQQLYTPYTPSAYGGYNS